MPEQISYSAYASAENVGQLFYRQIAPLDLFPEIPLPPGEIPVCGRIVDDSTIVLGGLEAHIRGQQRFVFNVGMHLRDNPQGFALPDLRTHGLLGSAKYIGDAIDGLNAKFSTDGFRFITPVNKARWRRYVMSPRLRLTDHRPPKDPVQEQQQLLRQIISGRIILPKRTAVTEASPCSPAQDISIVDDDTLLLRRRTRVPLNEHERHLLSLFLLLGGQPLTSSEVLASGFHYDAAKVGRDAALLRAIHSIGQKLRLPNSDVDALVLESTSRDSLIRWTQRITFTDRRPARAATDAAHAAVLLSQALVGDSRRPLLESPVIDQPTRKNPGAIEARRRSTSAAKVAFLQGSLTLREVVILSLHTGTPYDFLNGLHIPTATGYRQYEQLYDLTEGSPLPHETIGTLLGIDGHTTHFAETQALHKMPVSQSPSYVDRPAGQYGPPRTPNAPPPPPPPPPNPHRGYVDKPNRYGPPRAALSPEQARARQAPVYRLKISPREAGRVIT
ncbi:MAG TPA: hypothetical protein VLI54_04240, partial [Bacillota bacterium]|nr:hypothetical protein [Bacillota bacterium]